MNVLQIVGNITSLSCMESSVLWWSHNQLESNHGPGQFINDHEVNMVVSLSMWILYHGEQDKISKNDIVILTPYRSQVNNSEFIIVAITSHIINSSKLSLKALRTKLAELRCKIQ